MKREPKVTRKKKKAEFKTERKWLESKRKKAGKQLNQELNKGE